jgi:hypothetical protein
LNTDLSCCTRFGNGEISALVSSELHQLLSEREGEREREKGGRKEGVKEWKCTPPPTKLIMQLYIIAPFTLWPKPKKSLAQLNPPKVTSWTTLSP